jgi:hypothetical protein
MKHCQPTDLSLLQGNQNDYLATNTNVNEPEFPLKNLTKGSFE